jgi:hypothetical protein
VPRTAALRAPLPWPFPAMCIQAYYDKSKVTPEAVDAYRLPQLVKGWESGGSRTTTVGYKKTSCRFPSLIPTTLQAS